VTSLGGRRSPLVRGSGMTDTANGAREASLGPAESRGPRTILVVTQMIIRNPLLILALIALLWRHGVPMILSAFAEGVLGVVWTSALFVLRPFALVATWVDPYFRRFPEFVDVVGTLLLGLLPYVAGDAAYRRLTFRRNIRN
jgi:hypothetical protein